MNVNFELYKIFYTVVNNKSISKGAEVLLISQPAVTQAIKNLESQLGVTLFIRTKKGISLTLEGKELYYYIKEGMNYFINGTNKLLELKNLESGTLRIGASTSITEHFLIKYINKYHELYPNIEIKIINELTDNLINDLRNGSLDIVISTETFKDNKDIIFNPLSDINYIFVSNKKDDKLNEQSKLIIQSNPSIARNIFDNFIKENNIIFNNKMEVVSHRLVTELVKNNMGIGFVVKEYIKEDINKNLFEIKMNKTIQKRKIGYSILNNLIPTSAVKKFINVLINGKED